MKQRSQPGPVSGGVPKSSPSCGLAERFGPVLLAASFVLLGLALSMPGAALARQKAVVSWQVPRVTSAGTPIPFTWRGSHLGRNHHLVVQRPAGTAHVWKTMMRLPSNSGVGQLPGPPLGKYRYRIADLEGRHALAHQVAGVAVFGSVPFTTLFSREGSTYATPTSSFPYVEYWNHWTNEEAATAFTVERNNCASVHVAFVLGTGSYVTPGSVVTVSVVQESRDPVSASADYNVIGALNADLVLGQTWAVDIHVQEGIGEGDGFMGTYLNGYAICDSREPFFS